MKRPFEEITDRPGSDTPPGSRFRAALYGLQPDPQDSEQKDLPQDSQTDLPADSSHSVGSRPDTQYLYGSRVPDANAANQSVPSGSLSNQAFRVQRGLEPP